MSYQGPYSTSVVDFIARYVVTEAMVTAAIMQASRFGEARKRERFRRMWLEDLAKRAHVRRNIAIGIRAGSYSIEEFEASQRVRELVTA